MTTNSVKTGSRWQEKHGGGNTPNKCYILKDSKSDVSHLENSQIVRGVHMSELARERTSRFVDSETETGTAHFLMGLQLLRS